jgi:hypothetical protein
MNIADDLGHTIIYAEVNPVLTIRSEPEATLLILSASHVSSQVFTIDP